MTTVAVCLDTPLNVPQLVHICINFFDGDEEHVKKDSFPSALFHVHEWIADSCELMAHFITYFQDVMADDNIRLRICRAVGYWIRTCPTHFDSSLCRLVERLKLLAISRNIPNAATLLDLSDLPSYAWVRNISVRNPITCQSSFSFHQWSAEDIAVSLSHIDYKALFRIPITELKQYCIDGNLSRAPILERSISIFNSLSNWVQCMILNKRTAIERAEMITKFVRVGKHLKRLNNYNTLMAVIGGVTHSNIARLSKTSSALSSEIKKALGHFTQLLSSNSNFANYRKAIRMHTGTFCIPIMGVHLKDLISLQIKDQKLEKCRVVSCRKILQLAEHLSYFVSFNHTPHEFPDANIDLIHTLKVSLDIRYNEDDLYHLSLKCEPRTLLRLQSSTKSVIFADWASGVSSTLDPEIVNKHVSAMVEAVFKHYDDNKDGSISRSEFQQISTNFPFIAPFGTIDIDKDGQISKSEMKAYFIKVNKQSMEFRREFKHNFHETTFLTPTICAHCDKLLWGVIRQGFKCRDCGLVVHKSCKDCVVVECRKLLTNSTNNWWTTAITPEATKTSKKLLPVIKSFSRLRTVSATSERDLTDEGNAECSTTSACKVLLNLRSQAKKNRFRFETSDCYQAVSSPESPSTDLVPSLACEEVFEDDLSSISLSEISGTNNNTVW